jgi:hypothetical protein
MNVDQQNACYQVSKPARKFNVGIRYLRVYLAPEVLDGGARALGVACLEQLPSRAATSRKCFGRMW